MDINFEYYKIFYYVAKYRNLTQAAEVLYSNQPNVSRVIKQLERALGCTLLIRSNRGISLTPEGERLYSHVRIAVEQLMLGENEIKNLSAMEKGSITISVSDAALRIMVLPVLERFHREYPNIHIKIVNNLTRHALASLKKELVDFSVVTTTSAGIETPLRSYPVMKFKDILIGGPSYAAYQNTALSLQDTLAFPLICLGKDTVTYQFYEALYQRKGLAFHPDLETATTDQFLALVKSDLGIAYIPEAYAQEALANKEVYQLRVKDVLPARQICLVENSNHRMSVAAKRLKEEIMQEAKET